MGNATIWARPNVTTETIGFRCSPELRNELWRQAADRGVRPGPYIRQLLEAHIEAVNDSEV